MEIVSILSIMKGVVSVFRAAKFITEGKGTEYLTRKYSSHSLLLTLQQV